MVRVSRYTLACIFVALLAAGACLRADATQGAEGPAGAPASAPASAPETAPASAPETGLAASQPFAGDTASCPGTMVLVDGKRCTDVKQECVEWLDARGTHLARCAKFAPSVCTGERVHERFCIDRDEYVAPGQTLPAGRESWTQARTTCEREGKRLCRESEWELACEGEEAFPYTTGYERDSASCNFDKDHLVDPESGKLRDQREPASVLDRCVSPYGVRSMTGNVDEWVWRDHTAGPSRAALKGGWWMAARERCRPATTWHGEKYAELQTGFRCCADPPS